MSLRHTLLAAVAAVAMTGLAASAQAKTEITWWHAMGGELGKKVEEIAANFNKSQDQYELKAIYKGNYTETMTAAIAAFRAGQQPDIVQVFEVGTATMMAAKGAVYPVYKLMNDSGLKWDPNAFLPAVVGYYTDTDGNMLSMPFNSSTPVLYYNKDAFEKAGLDPNSPPKTWQELAADSKKIIDSGAATCGFTTGWQSWVQIENFSAWHNIPIGTKSNGFGGLDTQLTINSPLDVRHIGDMAAWQKDGIFKYGGRRSDSAPLFYSGECAMYMNSSGSYAGVKGNAKFAFGVGMLPYYDDVKGAPQNSIIGGATLWVLQGHDKAEYKGVAAFFNYLSSPEVQADWHQFSGYLPITQAAYELTKKQGFYEKNPGTDVAVKQITLNKPTENSKGLRFGNFVQIRDIINEELENIWAGKKSAKQGLDDAVKRGNELLRQFEADNS
ncbi:carbohydrate ABC transporter substrate-binding protein, CUT1 family [Tistlia consotensis]|uniref:sn-glycerol-3-phosphate-binding periplasmic protein UgpB n=1 Tax=Tistlia consotensis USBA 355 TaxID=560819 RepID=A0A1Y6B6B3_9PROT|nr:sn-glycerol-3-phosphate ABC transporter substrate-binding protein UgpB [Tistlia consotensis]SME94429.1 carbohydrate ABC transporter substrate-binding protein, CUT1 family [Tistlia consotensis USBA 355]SNR29324.1 carbohydrate ABC transporter substrate-binding protein, CUT1 family [Tistlia consotensis]